MNRSPSLTTLNLLVAVAQQASLSVASAKLGITQSAASRRIATLEANLGVVLLRRHRRGVELTDAGARYLASVSSALDVIAKATEAIRVEQEGGPLRLRVYSTFAARWLFPRLPDFQTRHPHIEVQLDTTVTQVSFERGDIDLAIQFGEGHWPDATSQLLIEDAIEPVCTPEFARIHRLNPETRALGGLRLLESRYRRSDWQDWATDTDTTLDGASFMRFPSSLLAYQAAIEGMGLAMGQTHFLAHELGDNILVAPFAHPLKRPLGYYLVVPRRPEPTRARVFRRWIMPLVD